MTPSVAVPAMFSWRGSEPRPVTMRVEVATAKDPTAKDPPCHRMPAFGSALIVPPPPDYSTPAAITKRCLEAGTHSDRDLRAAMRDSTVRKAYRDFRAVTPALAPQIADTHVSRWRVVGEPQHGFDLVEARGKR